LHFRVLDAGVQGKRPERTHMDLCTSDGSYKKYRKERGKRKMVNTVWIYVGLIVVIVVCGIAIWINRKNR
jgi:cytochrome b subunit of formate dehydrogenase